MLVEMVLTLFQAAVAEGGVLASDVRYEMEAVVPSCWVKISYLSRSLFFFRHCLVTAKQAASSGDGTEGGGQGPCLTWKPDI